MRDQLLFIEANTTGTGVLALHKTLSMGITPVFLTNDPLRYRGLEAVDCPIITCDTNSVAALMRTIDTRLSIERIVGITTTSEFYIEAVAQLTTLLELPGNTYEAIHACRNKTQTRLRLQVADIRQPRFAIVHHQSELAPAFALMAPPYVVKPVDETSSSSVRLCQNNRDGEEHAQSILATTHNIRGQQATHAVLIEEFLDAPEFSVEMFSWAGIATCVGITEKHVVGLPYFVEQRHLFPARLPVPIAQEMETTVRQALTSVGVTQGPTHTEVKLTPHGCAIIEINARLAGGMIPELIRYATEIDLLEMQLIASMGALPDLSRARQRHEYAGIEFLIAPVEGILERISGVEAARRHNGVRDIVLTARDGNPVRSPRDAYDRLGFIIASHPTYDGVVQTLQEARSQLTIHISPHVDH